MPKLAKLNEENLFEMDFSEIKTENWASNISFRRNRVGIN